MSKSSQLGVNCKTFDFFFLGISLLMSHWNNIGSFEGHLPMPEIILSWQLTTLPKRTINMKLKHQKKNWKCHTCLWPGCLICHSLCAVSKLNLPEAFRSSSAEFTIDASSACNRLSRQMVANLFTTICVKESSLLDLSKNLNPIPTIIFNQHKKWQVLFWKVGQSRSTYCVSHAYHMKRILINTEFATQWVSGAHHTEGSLPCNLAQHSDSYYFCIVWIVISNDLDTIWLQSSHEHESVIEFKSWNPCRYGCGQIFYRQEKYEIAAFHFESSLQVNHSYAILAEDIST